MKVEQSKGKGVRVRVLRRGDRAAGTKSREGKKRIEHKGGSVSAHTNSINSNKVTI